ncbi:MAG: hypothetical protein EOS58_25955 [Mesorhizobium sp.]|nr:hypothetical protein EOA33_12340 [Mesorhizobium sp. M4A.F.Ca.ET.050.02.1.1]RVC43347.1 hypothetical protein EN781_18550 [Mesorhizobium sp. M4A.F.Ca.ET.090.04.2.1]RVD22008.1 hypothetical protein EN742_36630 [Mesorhizobium sp. M4A.F.Ca.ET.020.02.1.1]RWC16425.1 MAG: hypothetical protein EOS53_19880 [Mesorhizobium sp.]RWC41382.1 MAG: hypothetical protein EOS54_26460 [Mesorhizobium sp.]
MGRVPGAAADDRRHAQERRRRAGGVASLVRARQAAGSFNFAGCHPFSDVGAAPGLPAGILFPYSDGERGALFDDFANFECC